MANRLQDDVERAYEITGILPKMRCEAIDSILGTVVSMLSRKNRRISDYKRDLVDFGEDCNTGSLCYIRMPT